MLIIQNTNFIKLIKKISKAFFYNLKAIIAKYEKDENLKNEYGKKAIDLYKLMNCNKDIDLLKNI